MRSSLALVMLIVLVVVAVHALFADPPTTQHRLRIGIYDSRAIAVACIRSAQYNDDLKHVARTAKPEQMQKRQTLAHLQGFGKHPVDDLLARVQDRIPHIAKEMNVLAIVSRADYLSDEVEQVDVTDSLVRLFNPDDSTLETIEELKKHPPIETLQLLDLKD